MLPTADAEVKAPHGLPSKSSTCGKTAALRTRVFHSLNFILIVYYIIDINCFILFILLSIDLSPCLIFLIDGIDVVLLFGVKLEHVGTTLRYPFTTFVISPRAACAREAPLVQERADDSEAWGGGRMVEFFAQSCPHCKHLEPIWKDASHKWAEQGQERENVVRINESDCGFFMGKMNESLKEK